MVSSSLYLFFSLFQDYNYMKYACSSFQKEETCAFVDAELLPGYRCGLISGSASLGGLFDLDCPC